jgi:hypothetical protein
MSDGNHPISKKTRASTLINVFHDSFRPDFPDWIRENFHIYEAFERRALRLINLGMKRGSAYEIVENIRWQSRLAELRYPDVDVRYKINNNFRPDLSRLFGLMNSTHAEFFERRVRTAEASAEFELVAPNG